MRRPIVGRWAVLIAGVALLALAGCQGQAAPAAEPVAEAAVATGTAVAPNPVPATATAVPTATPTETDTPQPTATATPTPTATATPVPQAVQLTTGGCCTQPFWSPDSQQVRFIDKPSQQDPVGIWAVDMAGPLAPPQLVSQRIEDSVAERDYEVATSGNTTTIVRLADGQRWTVPAGGERVSISPGQTRIAWTASNDDLPFEQRVGRVWVADLDGSDATLVATLPRGGFSGWIDEETVLINGWDSQQGQRQVLSVLSLADGSSTELLRANRVRSQTISPDRQWLVLYVTFDDDPSVNGLWLMRTDGSERRQLPPELFGAYQWRPCPETCARPGSRLLIVPFQPDARFHHFVEVDAAGGQVRQLTDPAVTPFKIANGDWRVSPDGRTVVFVESADRNIYAIALPE